MVSFRRARKLEAKADNFPNRSEKHTGLLGGSAFAEGLGCSHEVSFAWLSAGCDTAVVVDQSCGDSVSCGIAATRMLCVAETVRMLFEAVIALKGPDGMGGTVRNRSPILNEVIQVLS